MIKRQTGTLLALVLAAGLPVASLAWGCSSSSATATAGDPTTIDYVGSSDGCSVRADRICDLQAGETCACVDCQDTAYCLQQPGQSPDCSAPLQNDGVCDPIEDYCVCADCRGDLWCQSPASCDHQEACNPYLEGCSCDACGDAAPCVEDRAAHCGDAGPPGMCEEGESCLCSDCVLEPRCACVDDGMCALSEPCICADCAAEPHCKNSCVKDGKCDVVNEGCMCPDCAAACDAGGGSGGAGGMPDAGNP